MTTPLDQYVTYYDSYTRFVRTHQAAGAAAVVLGVALGAIAYYVLSQGVIPGLVGPSLAGTVTASTLSGSALLSAGLVTVLASYLLRVGKKRDRISHEALLCALSNKKTQNTQKFARVLRRWSAAECQAFRDYIQLHCGSEPFKSQKTGIESVFKAGIGWERANALKTGTSRGISMRAYLKNYQAEYRHRRWLAYAFMPLPAFPFIAYITLLLLNSSMLLHPSFWAITTLIASANLTLTGTLALMLIYLSIEKKDRERCNFDQFLVALTHQDAQKELYSLNFREHPLSYNKQAILDYIQQKYPDNENMRAIVESYTSMVP
ncbi:MAG: hypothetical protein S4CHLAM2_17510 [Chlamydiales bacterium]|nr:hypothetical protein [Chlamydiales bacterium]